MIPLRSCTKNRFTKLALVSFLFFFSDYSVGLSESIKNLYLRHTVNPYHRSYSRFVFAELVVLRSGKKYVHYQPLGHLDLGSLLMHRIIFNIVPVLMCT